MKQMVEAEKLMQIAMILPSAVLLGWGIGALAESHWHHKWMVAAGVLFGCTAGLVSVIRMAFATEKASRQDDVEKGKNGANGANGKTQ